MEKLKQIVSYIASVFISQYQYYLEGGYLLMLGVSSKDKGVTQNMEIPGLRSLENKSCAFAVSVGYIREPKSSSHSKSMPTLKN